MRVNSKSCTTGTGVAGKVYKVITFASHGKIAVEDSESCSAVTECRVLQAVKGRRVVRRLCSV